MLGQHWSAQMLVEASNQYQSLHARSFKHCFTGGQFAKLELFELRLCKLAALAHCCAMVSLDRNLDVSITSIITFYIHNERHLAQRHKVMAQFRLLRRGLY
jgi:hypothetical protein